MEISRLPELEQVSAPDATTSSCFHKLEVSEHISLLPCFVGRLSQGILEHLDKKLLRYSEQYGGVLLAYSKPSVQQTHGRILDEQPHIHFDLKYTAYVFRPVIDSIVCGTVNNVGRDHVGCLVYDCFNASVFSKQAKGQNRVNGLFSQFVVGSKIWFRVVSIENISGILSIIGEYFDITSLSQEEPSVSHNNEIDASLSQGDSTLELITHSSEEDEPTVKNVGRSPKKKRKDKHLKKKKHKVCLTKDNEGVESEMEKIVKVSKSKKHKKKSKMLEEAPARTIESDSSVTLGEKKKKGKKRKRSEDTFSETQKAKKLKVTDDSTKLSSKRHKHKR